jgi:hypothetical protein
MTPALLSCCNVISILLPAFPFLFGCMQPAGATPHGAAYRLILGSPDGNTLMYRRDPWARSAEAASSWCFVHSPAAYTWQNTQWQPLSHDKVGFHYFITGCSWFQDPMRPFSGQNTLHPMLSLQPAVLCLLTADEHMFFCRECGDTVAVRHLEWHALHRVNPDKRQKDRLIQL